MKKKFRREIIFGLLLAMSLTVVSCSSFCVQNLLEAGAKNLKTASAMRGAKGGTEERVVEKAFAAIKKNDMGTFKDLTITSADIILKRNKTSKLMEKASFAGSALKPEEQKRQREEFMKAVAGGSDQIDFSKSEFVGLGTLMKTGSSELLEGGFYTYWAYAVVIKHEGKVVDTTELFPYFVLTEWKDGARIIHLDYGTLVSSE
jgi:hypothetical protein